MFTPDKIFYTDIVRCVCDKYQVWLMAWRILTNLTINEAYIMREKITNGRYHDNDLILHEYIYYHDIFIHVESTICGGEENRKQCQQLCQAIVFWSINFPSVEINFPQRRTAPGVAKT